MFQYITTALTVALLMMSTPAAAHVNAQDPFLAEKKLVLDADKREHVKKLWSKSRAARDSCWANYYAQKALEAEQKILLEVNRIRRISGAIPSNMLPFVAQIGIRNADSANGDVSDLALLTPTQCDLETGDSSPPAS